MSRCVAALAVMLTIMLASPLLHAQEPVLEHYSLRVGSPYIGPDFLGHRPD
jgi:hypothetical protein